MKEFLKKIPPIAKFVKSLDNANLREEWVKKQLLSISAGSLLLDAGCGNQRYRIFCEHLDYKGQDFGQYKNDESPTMLVDSGKSTNGKGYEYGSLDYVGDIWEIDSSNESFDAILCTEVFEHIPHPIKTLKEFSRLLKPSGKLILTLPSACLRHMDPYFFYSGFSDRWLEKFLTDSGFEINSIEPVGDYYSWLGVEMVRTFLANGIFAKLLLLPAVIYFRNKKKTLESTNTLCMGYHVIATKL
jgi:SAM-dependent methyltransferase